MDAYTLPDVRTPHTHAEWFDFWVERSLWWAKAYQSDLQCGRNAHHAITNSKRCADYAMEYL